MKVHIQRTLRSGCQKPCSGIAFDGSKFVSESGDYKELAASLTKAADAYRLVRESASSLSDDSQLQLLQLISQEIQKYNVAIEQKANKDRQAAQAAAEAAAADSRKREEYLSSAEAVNSQIGFSSGFSSSGFCSSGCGGVGFSGRTYPV